MLSEAANARIGTETSSHSFAIDKRSDRSYGTSVPANTCHASNDFATRLKVM